MKKIVVAEDDGQLRPWIVEIVEKMGFCCLQASNGARALHLMEDNPDVAMLICDAMMPELNGEELVKIVRGRQKTRDVPIIFLSAVRRHEEVSRLMNLGASRFISKPLIKSDLCDVITELLPHETQQKYKKVRSL